MLPQQIFSESFQDFIRKHGNEDPGTIVLKKITTDGIPPAFIAAQVSGRKKAKEKIPIYAANPFVIFPPQVNLEQSSSQATAEFKADFIKSNIPDHNTCADLTGGFGVDSFFFSKVFKNVDYIESDESIFEIARHNHQQLKVDNIIHHRDSAEDFLKAGKKFDLIFIDPSRRKEGNQKVNSLRQSEPDVVELQNQILSLTRYCLIKASPLLDLQHTLNELRYVKRVIVVSVKNECKELLFLLEVGHAGEAVIDAVNIHGNGVDHFEFQFSDERNVTAELGSPKTYLYEPNASILKAGAFKSIADKFHLFKIHQNTHLYTSDELTTGFPGRVFRIEKFTKADAKIICEIFPTKKVNLITRNYPMSPDELKKKLGLIDGDSKFLIGFTGIDKKYLVVAERV